MRLAHNTSVVFQGSAVSLLFGSLGRFSLDVAAPIFMFDVELAACLLLFCRFFFLFGFLPCGSPTTLYRFGRLGFIYKAGQKHVSSRRTDVNHLNISLVIAIDYD